MKSGSIAGKLISLFITSLIMTVGVLLTSFPNEFIVLFFPIYFIFFAVSLFISFPTSYLVEKLSLSTRNVWKRIFMSIALSIIILFLILVILLFTGFNINQNHILYGITTYCLFITLDNILSFAERKTRNTNKELKSFEH